MIIKIIDNYLMVEESKQISHEGMHIISQGAEGVTRIGVIYVNREYTWEISSEWNA